VRFFVTLTPPAFDTLRDIARAERRTARAQAAVLLEELLRRERGTPSVPPGESRSHNQDVAHTVGVARPC
jgi:hypothetical protein